MGRFSLQKASIACLVIWAVIWVMFMAMRFSPLDIRLIPGIGIILLSSLAFALAAPALAAVLAGAALIRRPREPRTVLILGCAIAALVGQMALFRISRWM